MSINSGKLHNCLILITMVLLAAIFNPSAAWALGTSPQASETILNITDLTKFTYDDEDGQKINTGIVDESGLFKKLAEGSAVTKVTVSVTGNSENARLKLTSSLVKALGDRGISVEFQTSSGSLTVPVGQINISQLAGRLGVPTANATVQISVLKPDPGQVAAISGLVARQGLTQAAPVVMYKVEAVGANETLEVNGLPGYFLQTVEMDRPVDPNAAVGVMLDAKGELWPVPTQFTEKNGKTAAIIKHKSNGTFTVVENQKSFTDMKKHWAGYDVDVLASKLVISGNDDGTFNPGGKITRAQLAVLTARALGLPDDPQAARFRDIKPNYWYTGAIGASVKAGLIKGYNDGTFRPNAYVTREQVAAILAHALKSADGSSLPGSAEMEHLLARFRDKTAISGWAGQFVAAAVKCGIINGDNTGAFGPRKLTTRAEAAVMIRKMMSKTGLISSFFRIATPVDHLRINKSTAMVTGWVESGSSVAVNGSPAHVEAGGAFSAEVKLSMGSNILNIRITDHWGHSITVTRTVIYDTGAPGFSVATPEPDLITNKKLLTVTGYAEPGSIITVNGMPADCDETGNFSRVIELTPGKNIINVTDSTVQEKELTVTRTVIYDNEPPILSVISPEEGLETGTDILVVTGYTEPGTVVKVNGKGVPVDEDGNFSKVIDLDVKSNTITVTATDSAYNTTTETRTVIFNDNRVPELTLPDQIRIGLGISIQYKLTVDAYVTVKIYDEDGDRVRSLAANAFKTAGMQLQIWDGKDESGRLIKDGSYRFVVEARNGNGEIIGRAEKVQTAARVPKISKLIDGPDPFNPPAGEKSIIEFDLDNNALVSVYVYKGYLPVRTIIANLSKASGSHTISWDGRDDSGNLVEKGLYTYQIDAMNLIDQSFMTSARGTVTVNQGPPTAARANPVRTLAYEPGISDAGTLAEGPIINDFTVLPDPFRIGGSNLNIMFTQSRDSSVTLRIVDRNTGNTVKTILDHAAKKAGFVSSYWDGKDSSGNYVAEGEYEVELTVSAGDDSEDKEYVFKAGYKPVISNVSAAPAVFNPTGASEATISYNLSNASQVDVGAIVTVQIMKGYLPVRTIIDKEYQEAGSHTVSWNGKDDSGNAVADGIYNYQITVTSTSVDIFFTTFRGTVTVEQGNPSITDLMIYPNPFKAERTRAVSVNYQLSEDATVSVMVYDQGGRLCRTVIGDQPKRAGYNSVSWDGKTGSGNMAAQGQYTIVIRAVDAFGKKAEVSEKITFYPHFGVAATNPANEAKDVPLDAKIVVTLNDFAKKGSGFSGISLKVEDRPIQYRAELLADTLTITPSAELAYGTKYTLTIPIDAITDTSGKPFAEPYHLTFTTETAERQGINEISLSGASSSSVTVTGQRTNNKITINEAEALKILDRYENVRTAVIAVTAPSDEVTVELPSGLLQELLERNMSIKVQTTRSALTIPADEISLTVLADRLGVDKDDVNILIMFSEAEAATVASYRNMAGNLGLSLAANPISFRVEAFSGEKRVEIGPFKKRIGFIIYLPANVSQFVGGVTAKSGILPVPTGYVRDSGRNAAVIKTKTGGTFAVIENKRVFRDMSKHWAENDVRALAARLVISGVNDTTFAPKRNVTRAEFATMLVRALGIEPSQGYSGFADVKAGAWYAGYVSAAVEAGIVSGYRDGTFRPNTYIKREEAAAMVSRALELADMKIGVSENEAGKYLEVFKDKAEISPWARVFVAGAAKSGLIKGYQDHTFAPGKNITRAESAALVRNMMIRAGLI